MLYRDRLVKIGRTLNRFPQFLINYFKNAIIPTVSLFTIAYFIFLLLGQDRPIAEFILPSLIFIALLLIFTVINYNKSKVLTDIIVFFNILIFFIIIQPDSILYKDILELPVIGNLNYNLLIIGILLPVIGFFLVFRDRIKTQKEMFFSGLDLVIILIVLLLSITSGMIPISKSYLIADTIFRSFLIYTFYKVLIYIKPKFRIYLYILSFLIAVSSQIIFLFF